MTRTLKIGFIGAQGTGKTTRAYGLATDLKKRGHDVFVLTEVARSCPMPINEGVTKEAQLWIFGKLLTREQSSKGSILIGDRTLLDVLVYGIRCNKEVFNPLMPFVKEYMKTYDIIFYLEPNDEYLIEDKIRSTNKEFRDQIDNIMLWVLKELDIKYVKTEDHLGYVMEKLKENQI